MHPEPYALSELDYLRSIWVALRRLESVIAPVGELPPPIVNVEPPDLSAVVNAVNGLKPGVGAQEIAEALRAVLAPETRENGTEALQSVAEALKKLDFRLQSAGTQAYGGGTAVLDRKEAAKLAKEATLQDVFKRTDPLAPGTNTIGRVDVNVPIYTAIEADASVPAGTTFTTVVADTPATDLTLVGYNAEVASLVEARMRMRLITGTDLDPTVHHIETVTTGANGWQPLHLSVASGTRVAVQVVHDQISSQMTSAVLNWSNP